jgi:ribosomal-protein-alanine N-acetyltransferase
VDGPVLLRRPSARDAEEFLDRVRASRRLHRPWSAPPDTAEAYATFLRTSRRRTTDTSFVCRREDGAIVGVYDLSQIFYGSFCSAYLGYYAFVPFAGNGFMRAGMRLVLARAFGDLGLHRVQANVQPGNEASLALVRGAGFRREGFSPRYLKVAGRWRDHESWALLAEEHARVGRSADAGPRRTS